MRMMPVLSQDFIGRERVLKDIRRPLERFGRRSLVSIQGRGGVGKTSLLKKLYEEYARRDEMICFPVVDFSQSKTRTRRWLMDHIAGRAFDNFTRYHDLAEAKERQSATAAQALTQADLEEAFFDDFVRCEQDTRCLFLFDTLELIQDTLIIDFLIEMIGKARNSAFVLAGRRNDEIEDRLQQAVSAGGLVSIGLAGFDEEDALLYVRQHAEGADLSPDEQRALYLLAEGGVPIKLALALDWLSRGFVMHTLAEYPLDELHEVRQRNPDQFQAIVNAFEHELVTQIGQLGTLVDQAIYIMAHVHKRFNRELLELTLPAADADALLPQIAALPFVKHIEDDFLVLHDEVQRMVEDHVWNGLDPDRAQRRALSAQVVAYYDRKLAALGRSTTVEDRIYEIERLHYQLDLDLVEGYHQFIRLFEEFEDRRDIGDIELAALALDVLIKDHDLLPRLRSFVITYYYGWILVRRKHLAQAREHIERSLRELAATPAGEMNAARQQLLEREVEQRLGEIYTLQGYCHRLLGDWTTAIRLYEQGRKFNENLIDQLQQTDPQDPELIRRSIRRLAETLNDIANLQRMQGDLDAARRYCKVSLLIRQGLREDRAVGHCCYVMAMILWELGNTSEAMHYLQQARRRYRLTGTELLERAWIDRYLGFVMYRTGNTQEAQRLLNQALDAASSNRGLQDEHAETLIYLSRLHRDQNTPESRRQALKEAQTALQIAREVPNDYRITECYWIICLVLADMLRDTPADSALREQFQTAFTAGLTLAQHRNYGRLEAAFVEIDADRDFERKDVLSAFEKYGRVCRRAMEFKPAVFARALSKLAERLYQLVRENAKQALSVCNRLQAQWADVDRTEEYAEEFLDEVDYVANIARDAIRRQELERQFVSAFHVGDWQESLDACKASDAIMIYMHPDRAIALHHRAEVYHGSNRFSRARLCCERAIRIRQAYEAESAALGDSYLLCSRIDWKLGATAESASYLDRAEEQYRSAGSDVGLGLIELDRAYIYFRTHQFGQISAGLAKAQDIFRRANEQIYLASALNLMSRFVRVDPRQPGGAEEIAYMESQRHGEEALQILGDKDWFVAAEINLTLCILHYNWGRALHKEGRREEAEEHFARARWYHDEGWKKIERVNSPMLYSVYHGMLANLSLQAGQHEEAQRHFLNELVYAAQTKHMRLARALDLLEDWLVSEPLEAAQEFTRALIDEWQRRGLAKRYPQAQESLRWLLDHRPYIFSDGAPA